MSSYTDSSVRLSTDPYRSYQPTAQYYRPPACQMGQGPMPSYAQMQPTEPCPSASASLSNGGLASLAPTLLTSKKPAPITNADKESCVEEGELDDDEKLEESGQSQDYTYCGIDFKPVLPLVLAVSTVTGGLCMLLVQIPMVSRFTLMPQAGLSIPMSALYVLVLGCMAYTAYADPGQMKNTSNAQVGPWDLEEGLPRRAHRSWQYPRPIRRYDHYCKWLQNVIGLLNHGEFVLMVAGLVLISVIGIIIDIWLAVLMAEKAEKAEKRFFESEIILVLHLGYSMALLAFDGPILRIHAGLISRNEMAHEWKKNEHYVANNTTMGNNVPVEDLDDDEFNDFFDRKAFVYDRSRNTFDNGCFTNCWKFWCQPRSSDAKGEF